MTLTVSSNSSWEASAVKWLQDCKEFNRLTFNIDFHHPVSSTAEEAYLLGTSGESISRVNVLLNCWQDLLSEINESSTQREQFPEQTLTILAECEKTERFLQLFKKSCC